MARRVPLLLAALSSPAAAALVTCTGSPALDTAAILSALPTVALAGVCALNATLRLPAQSRLTGATPNAALVGGVPLFSTAPVADPAVLAQLPTDAARAAVRQVDLVAAGVPALGASAGLGPWASPCLAYAGASAALNYGSYLASSVELFWGAGDADSTIPLTPARWPNADEPFPGSWAPIVEAGVNKSDNLYFRGPPSLAARSAAWANQVAADVTSIGLTVFTQPLFWATNVGPLQAFVAPDVLRSMYCMDFPSSEEVPATGGAFFVSNVLAELDTPGEYYVNRTSGMAYVWPPAAATPHAGAGAPTAWASLLEDLVVVQDAAGVSIEGVSLGVARGAALVANNATGLRVVNASLANIGNMALNVTGGGGNLFSRIAVAGAGNGGAYLVGGDRSTLARSGHVIADSTFTDYNRHQVCYTPGVALDGVGHTLERSEIHDAPHQAVWVQGNFHSLSRNSIHDVCQITEDSGAVYAGRDWTYQGNVIEGNVFANINTLAAANGRNNVQAVYLDDLVSGFAIFGNTFVNVSRALHLGGGRSIVFQNNTIRSAGNNSGNAANHIDNRGMGWDARSCTPPNGTLVEFLARVPYATSDAWLRSFPVLAGILRDEPCQAKYNLVADNVLCGIGASAAFDVSPSTFASWGSVMRNNTVAGQC